MEVFSEGFLVSQALYLDDSCQYFFPKHYRRLTNANFHPNLSKFFCLCTCLMLFMHMPYYHIIILKKINLDKKNFSFIQVCSN